MNELLRDDEWGKILFAHILNENGCDTGVDTVELAKQHMIKAFEGLNEIGDDNMEQPEYYASNGLSPIDAFQRGLISKDELVGFYKGNIIKYVVRAGKKESAVSDLLKAKSYINFYLELFLMPSEEAEALEKDQQATFKELNTIEENHRRLEQKLMLEELEDQDVKEDD